MSVSVYVLDQLDDGLGYAKVGEGDFNDIVGNTTEGIFQIKPGQEEFF